MQLQAAVRDPLRLGPFVEHAHDAHLALPVGVPGHETLAGRSLRLGHRADHRVGRRQDARPRAEVRVERQLGRRRAVGLGELLREPEQVVQRRATPRVDVLIRVSDRGDRVAGAEQRGHQLRLRDVRVLILVEQDGLEARAMVRDHIREPVDDLQRAVDLVAEVDHAELGLQFAVDRGGLDQLDPLLGRLVRALGAVVLQHVEPVREPGQRLVRCHAVVLQLVVELQDLAHERGLERRQGELEGHAVQDPAAELLALRLVQHTRTRLEAGEHAVALEQRRREPVVVHDLGLFTLGQIQRGKRATHPKPQVVRRLVRERQAQDVARHHAGALRAPERAERQVHHARGHHGGLARARAGDQHAGLERPGDRVPLFVGGLGAHRGHDLGRRDARAHRGAARSNTCCPSGNSGHSDLKSHQ